MTVSKLSRLFELIQEAETPLSLDYLARRLGISPRLAENMLQYWIHKGRISQTTQTAVCDRCGVKGSCPNLDQLPASYQLVEDDGDPGRD